MPSKQTVLAIVVLLDIVLVFLLYHMTNWRTDSGLQKCNNFTTISLNYSDINDCSINPSGLDDFQHVADFLYAYSAYYDNISGASPTIRVIVMDNPKKEWNPFLECYYYDENLKLLKTTIGTKILSPDSYNMNAESSLAFISCELSSELVGINPEFVSVYPMKMENLTKVSLNKLRIHYPLQNQSYDVVSCIQPLHSAIERPLPLLEFLEYYKMLGVQHFTFYNFSIGLKTSEILKSYSDKEMSILDWNLPFVDGTRVWGQFIAASECAYRHRGVAKYVMTFDIDEFLVPRGRQNDTQIAETFTQFFDEIWNRHETELKANLSSIKFESKISFGNWPKKNFTVDGEMGKSFEEIFQNLQLLSRVNFYPSGQTKFVMRPEFVIESGVHWAEIEVNGTKSLYHDVDKDGGYYLHFRNCESYFHQPNQILKNNATCLSREGMNRDDFATDNFGEKLAERVMRKVKEIIKSGVLKYEDFILIN